MWAWREIACFLPQPRGAWGAWGLGLCEPATASDRNEFYNDRFIPLLNFWTVSHFFDLSSYIHYDVVLHCGSCEIFGMLHDCFMSCSRFMALPSIWSWFFQAYDFDSRPHMIFVVVFFGFSRSAEVFITFDFPSLRGALHIIAQRKRRVSLRIWSTNRLSGSYWPPRLLGRHSISLSWNIGGTVTIRLSRYIVP